LRIASLAICLVTAASFVGFAVEQSKAGSNHQQAEVNAAAPVTASTGSAGVTSTKAGSGKSAFRKFVDDAFSKVASPFSGLTRKLSSQWTLHIVNALLALLIYGFGLGFLARALRLGD
jgi:hypothetical protein